MALLVTLSTRFGYRSTFGVFVADRLAKRKADTASSKGLRTGESSTRTRHGGAQDSAAAQTAVLVDVLSFFLLQLSVTSEVDIKVTSRFISILQESCVRGTDQPVVSPQDARRRL